MSTQTLLESIQRREWIATCTTCSSRVDSTESSYEPKSTNFGRRWIWRRTCRLDG